MSKSVMKAFIMDNERKLRTAEVPVPQVTENTLLLKTSRSSICGTDVRTYKFGHKKISVPRVLGHEMAGKIVDVGANLVNEYQIGDRITVAPAIGCGECYMCKKGHTNMCDNLQTIGFQFDGSFAEYVLIPEEAIKMKNVIKLPDSIDDDNATLIEPAATALNAQSYLKITEGDNVVIAGGGLIGSIHAELALIQGANKVFISEPIESRGRQIEELIDGVKWLNSNDKDLSEQILELTDGNGADVVIAATSYAPIHSLAQDWAAKRGRISLFGGLPGEATGYLDSNKVHYKELQVFGAHATTTDFMRQIMDLVVEGKLNLSKYIEKYVDLDSVEEGFEEIVNDGIMKVVIKH